jgi:O-antigen ligase
LLLLLGLYARRSLIQQKVGLVGIVILGGALALLLTNVNNIKLFGGSSDQTHGTAAPTAVIDQATNFNAQDDRVRNRTLAWEAFQDHPWLGIGPGNFSDYAKERYDGYQSISGAIVVNNEPMELLAESGLLGLLTFFGFVVIVFSALLRIVLEGGDNLSDWSYSLLAYFIALAIQYQTFSTLYIVHVWVTLGIAMGIVSMSSRTIKTSEKKKLPLQYPENLSS